MGRSNDSSGGEILGGLLIFLVFPAVGGAIAALGWWLLVPLVPLVLIVCAFWVAWLLSPERKKQRRREVAAAQNRFRQEQRRAAEAERRRQERQAAERESARKKAEAQEREAARKKAEEERRCAVARRKAERRERVEEFGESAVRLIERAQSAADRVVVTEAAYMGWLGDPGELDFSPDLLMITTSLRSGANLRKLAGELKALPDHTDGDRARLADAKRSAEKLWRQASDRAKLLEECATQARRIDESLKEEREEARIAELRDDVASRLDAALYGVAATPESPPSDSADKVIALVAAYQEIKGTLERDRLGKSDSEDADAGASADNPSSWGVLAPINRAWHWAFG